MLRRSVRLAAKAFRARGAVQIWAITRTVARVTGERTRATTARTMPHVETLNGVPRPSYQLGDARQLMLPGALSGVSAAGRR